MYSRTCIEQKENVKERLIMRLLEPIKVGKIELKNRVMFPPMTTGYEGRDGTIVEQSFNFYKRLAEGGVSYIVLGDVAPVNTISPTPKLFHDGQIEAFRKLADAVHEFDCKLGIQIFHPEYDVEALAELFRKGDMEGGRAKMRHDMVHFIQEVTEEQLNSILDKIGECVKRAQSAGVDIIEVHGDRLIGSFCSTLINRRTDSYGGSFENRIRFALRVVDKIREVRKEYPDVSVVCYVNSTAEIKAESDVCVTSSNALKIVKNLPNKDIFFIPDENLGRFVASQLPEKHFIFNDGFCHVHKSIHKEELQKAKEAHPEALVLTHPECTGDILELSDFIGSTSQIIDYATKSENNTFIICTEMGVFYELHQKNPEKKFYSVGHRQFCPNMKMVRLEGVKEALETMQPAVNLDEEMRQKAALPLEKMLKLAAR